VLAAFDFIPDDFDLKGLLLDLYSTQVLGMYDDEEDTFLVVSEGDFDLMDRVTFAHEYTHSLQDQHFDLEAFIDEDRMSDDQIMARLALVEGDATLTMSDYLMAHRAEITAADMAALQGEDGDEGQALLDSAPRIIRDTFEFPYLYGFDFVVALQQQGWPAVDAAFADPPQSTEQILHPEKYFNRDEPQLISLPPLTDTLGLGWQLAYSDTLGEFQTALYLVQQMDEATATSAAQGWDGDQYAVYSHGQDRVLVFATVWDSVPEREEFVAAYTLYAEARYGTQGIPSDRNELWWETPDQAAVLAWNDTTALIVTGPDLATVERVLAVVR
jgi:hypothetical protein